MKNFRCLIALLSVLIVFSSCQSRFPQQGLSSAGEKGEKLVLDQVPLIPRSVLFGPGERMRVRMSPDGRWLASIQPVEEKGVVKYGIFVTPIAKPQEKGRQVLPQLSERFPEYHWTMTPGFMTYTRDVGGNENDQLFILDINKKSERNLTQNTEVKVQGVYINPDFPGFIYFSDNSRDPKFFDLMSYNLKTKKVVRIFENTENFLHTLLDRQNKPRLAMKYNADGGMDLFIFEQQKWQLLKTVPFEFVPGFNLISYDTQRDVLYYTDGSTSDTGDLIEMSLKSREVKKIAHHPKAQITGAITRFDGSGRPLAYLVEYEKEEITALDPSFEAELAALREGLPSGSQFSVVSQTAKDDRWLLAVNTATTSIHYYSWDRKTRKAQMLFAMKPELDRQPLVEMHPVVIKSRDGLSLVSYLSLPKGVTWDPINQKVSSGHGPIPMVLDVHGGPWARDSWGLNPTHQLYANRGYAVLSVNYRGSTGFGQRFEAASFGEWGAKMHDDLIDATEWAITRGIALRDKVAITGGSYGGYAVLVGLTFTPEVFAVGVNTVGVANLVTMQKATPEYWKAFKANSIRRMGADVETPEGEAFLWSRSPLSKVGEIRRPLLVGHGDNDPRVKLEEAQQITAAMVQRNLPVTLVRFPDEGHGFARPENSQSYEAITEVFLAKFLGGRAEPLAIDPNSSINVAEGADLIPGLCEELKKVNKKGEGCP